MDKIVLSTKVSSKILDITLTKQVARISAAIDRCIENFPIAEMLESISNSFDELSKELQNIYGDGISGYEKWGDFGWTYCPSLDYDMFKTAPTNVEEANKTMGQFLSNEEIEKIRYALEVAEADKDELDEAFQCFCEGKYKACSLLLFGIIDKRLYDFGFTVKRKNQVVIATGKTAVDEFDKKTHCYDYTIFAMLTNIVHAIKRIFEYGNDFKDEMIIINRNYLAHGLSKRKISKLECFQIWCLAYSTCVYIDVLRKCNDDYEKEQSLQEVIS